MLAGTAGAQEGAAAPIHPLDYVDAELARDALAGCDRAELASALEAARRGEANGWQLLRERYAEHAACVASRGRALRAADDVVWIARAEERADAPEDRGCARPRRQLRRAVAPASRALRRGGIGARRAIARAAAALSALDACVSAAGPSPDPEQSPAAPSANGNVSVPATPTERSVADLPALVRGARADILGCFPRGEDPASLVLDVTVSDGGTIESARAVASPASPAAEPCIAAVVRRYQLPSGPRGRVVYTVCLQRQ